MATKLRELRIQARKLKIPNARELDLDELKAAVAEASGSKNGKASKGKAVKAVKAVKAAKRGPGRPRKVEEDEEDEAPKRRGRPPGTKNKSAKSTKSTTKKATGAKRGRPRKSESEDAPKRRGRPPKSESGRGTPERKQARKASGGSGKVGRPVGSGTGTRVKVPEQIKWEKDFDFREGTIAGVILDELRSQASKKRNKDTGDIREATIEALTDEIGSDPFVFKHRDGTKLGKAEARNMLRYRVNRTIFDYVKETNQHNGSGGGSSTAKKSGRKAKAEAETTPKRRGRPPGSGKATKATKTEKATGKRRGRPPGSGKKAATGTTGKKRGRPKGSKNKR